MPARTSGNQSNVDLQINLSDNTRAGINQAVSGLGRLDTAAENAQDAITGTSSSVQILTQRFGPMLAGIASVVSVSGLATKAFKDWSATSRDVTVIREQIRNIGAEAILTEEKMDRLITTTSELADGRGALLGLLNENINPIDVPELFGLAEAAASIEQRDFQSIAKDIGRAVSDVELKLSRFNSQLLLMTKSEVDAAIALAKAGKEAEAQALVIDALRKKYGGIKIQDPAGIFDEMGSAVTLVSEKIGALIAKQLTPFAKRTKEISLLVGELLSTSQKEQLQINITDAAQKVDTLTKKVEKLRESKPTGRPTLTTSLFFNIDREEERLVFFKQILVKAQKALDDFEAGKKGPKKKKAVEAEDVLAAPTKDNIVLFDAQVIAFEQASKAESALNKERTKNQQALFTATQALRSLGRSTLAEDQKITVARSNALEKSIDLIDAMTAKTGLQNDALRDLAQRYSTLNLIELDRERSLTIDQLKIDMINAQIAAIGGLKDAVVDLSTTETIRENLLKQAEQSQIQIWQNLTDQGINVFANSMTQAFVNGRNALDAFKVGLISVGKQFVATLIKIGVQKLVASALEKNLETQKTSNVIINSRARSAALAPEAAVSALATGGVSVGTALAALAVGVVASLALVKVFKGQAHGGLSSVPSTGTYLLEQGEMVSKKQTVDKLDAFMRSAGNTKQATRKPAINDISVSIGLNVSALDGQSVVQALDRVEGQIKGMAVEGLMQFFDQQGIRI